MSEWITDRRPTFDDAYTGWVWVTTEHGVVLRQTWELVFGRPWQPIVPPEPYVKAKRYEVRGWNTDGYVVCRLVNDRRVTAILPTREAAERIRAIYEEVMP